MTPDIEDAIQSAVYVEPPAGVAYGAAREATQGAAQGANLGIVRQAAGQIVEAIQSRSDTLVMNDRRLAQVMAGATARAQAARNRSVALGYGK